MVDVAAEPSPFVLLQDHHIVLLVVAGFHDEHHDDGDEAHDAAHFLKDAHQVVPDAVICKLLPLKQKVPVHHQFRVLLVRSIDARFLDELISFLPLEKVEVRGLVDDAEDVIL